MDLITIKNRLSTAQQKQETTTNADRYAELTVTIKHLKAQLATLEAIEQAKRTAEQEPEKPTDRQSLTAIIEKRKAEHVAKLDTIRQQISETRQQKQEAQTAFERCTAQIDTAGALGASAELERLTDKERYLSKMMEQAERLPVFAPGELSEAWAEIVKESAPVYRQYVANLKASAELYRKCMAQLHAYHDFLVAVRGDFATASTAHGLSFDPKAGTITPIAHAELEAVRILPTAHGWIMAEMDPPFRPAL